MKAYVYLHLVTLCACSGAALAPVDSLARDPAPMADASHDTGSEALPPAKRADGGLTDASAEDSAKGGEDRSEASAEGGQNPSDSSRDVAPWRVDSAPPGQDSAPREASAPDVGLYSDTGQGDERDAGQDSAPLGCVPGMSPGVGVPASCGEVFWTCPILGPGPDVVQCPEGSAPVISGDNVLTYCCLAQ